MLKHHNSKPEVCNSRNRGVVLLVVLFVVMAVTVISLGFIWRSDIELACGSNMVVRGQVDYLAESALEHAKGLILNPQELASEYWTGGTGQQLTGGSNDYYDVRVVRDDSDPTNQCDFVIDCNAYRIVGGEETGRSSLSAELRLDPCVSLWLGSGATIPSAMTVNGDVYCDGGLINEGTLNGDVYCSSLSGSIVGQEKECGDLSLGWPRVTVSDFTSNYSVQSVTDSSLSGDSLGGSSEVFYRIGNLTLAGNVSVDGMLVVDGDLTIQGTGNIIVAEKNLPAVLVTGDVVIQSGGEVDVNGLAVVDGQVQVNAGAVGFSIVGGLFAADGVVERTVDSSGNGNIGTLYNGPTWQPSGGHDGGGALEFDGVDDYVQTADDASKLQLTSGNYTLSAWIKPDAVQNTWAAIFSKCNPSGSTNHWTLQFDSSSSRKIVMYHPSGNWDTGIKLSDVAGAWHQIKVVRLGSAMKSYLDGTKIKEESWTASPGVGLGHLNIGADRTASSSYVYKGLIDDVRVYNSAPAEGDDYPSSSDLLGQWELDESGISAITITAAPSKTAIWVWSGGGVKERWGQAAGAFFRSIERR